MSAGQCGGGRPWFGCSGSTSFVPQYCKQKCAHEGCSIVEVIWKRVGQLGERSSLFVGSRYILADGVAENIVFVIRQGADYTKIMFAIRQGVDYTKFLRVHVRGLT